ncbi:hypothetical protein GGQ92_002784 [Gracilibacillus halotolerans]|uniref:Uncharacterized protein n=1 Tax=Gracilibacillus halotolerans TaxID=74386 RepID=A0A841RRY0_9BACI|nr:hypothetical protein [Gracilibacillus halotolerans]MBB6513965.1 hypothetical protein [Gracilibacillus halotolerans]
MFFKEDKNHDKESIHTALFTVFFFWGIALLSLSTLELFNIQLNISYLTLLLAGLLVFFSSELIARYLRKSKS